MSNKQFISNLSATYADIRKLDVKKINLKGKNILEYIKENATVILDERGTKADDELDIWNSYVTKDVNGNVIINRNAKPYEHDYSYLSSTGKINITRGSSCVHVIDNEILDANNEHVMYWQTDGFTDTYAAHIFQDSLKTFSSDLSSLTDGSNMFYNCYNLKSFSSNLSNLTNSGSMFSGCYNLESFSSDLSSLTNGSEMFYRTKITSFSSDLSSLTIGEQMFYGCISITSFSSDLSNLTDGYYMFRDCSNLTSFSSDLSSLMDGYYMFADCSKLESFNADLSSLTNGSFMFEGCKLNYQSVANIIHFIPQRDAKPTSTISDGKIQIGIGITNTDAAKQAFAEGCYCDDWAELNKEFDDKNWAVQWQFNGEATTFDLRGERPSTAVYTKLEEVFMPTEEEIAAAKEKGEHIQIPHYQYTSQDGDNYYNIHWYHDSNTNNEGYDYFESLEEAISAYSVIPNENIMTTEE